ncbi:MAG: NUDIX domain-containing protein [Anaerolineae bacterium]
MNDMFSYKDSFLEAVMFMLHDKDKILVEKRVETERAEWFIPNGKIELIDKSNGVDYKIAALKREMSEELSGTAPTKYRYISEFKVEEIKAIFYIYIIDSWDGEIPKYNFEDGQLSSELHWKTTVEARALFSYPILHHALDLLTAPSDKSL